MKIRCVLFILIICGSLSAQSPQEQYSLFLEGFNHLEEGNILIAKDILEPLLDIPEEDLYFGRYRILQIMGNIYSSLWEFEKALEYFSEAEAVTPSMEKDPFSLVLNYNSRGNLLTKMNDFKNAEIYYGKALRLLTGYGDHSTIHYKYLSEIYTNYGQLKYKLGDYKDARRYYNQAISLRKEKHLPYPYSQYLKLAMTWDRTGNFSEAESVYSQLIKRILSKEESDFQELKLIYIEYAELLMIQGRYQEAEDCLIKAIQQYKSYYPGDISGLASATQIMGDMYNLKGDYKMALENYQEALVVLHPDFSPGNIAENPALEGSHNNSRYIEILRHKARAFYNSALEQEKLSKRKSLLETARSTLLHSIRVKNQLQSSFNLEESRINLSEKEKFLYTDGIKYNLELYKLKQDPFYLKEAYNFVGWYKASELQRLLSSRETIKSLDNKSLVLSELKRVQKNIREYSAYVTRELAGESPDSAAIDSWNDELFILNRSYDSLNLIAEKEKWYAKMSINPDQGLAEELQKKIGRNQLLIDYVFANEPSDSLQLLYTFLISNRELKVRTDTLDKSFRENLEFYVSYTGTRPDGDQTKENIDSVQMISAYLYNQLLRWVDDNEKSRNWIIIPDEDLFLLTFESLTRRVNIGENENVGVKDYLLWDHIISYAYSSGFVFSDERRSLFRPGVVAFAPGIGNKEESESIVLQSAREEVESVSDIFPGDYYFGEDAVKNVFVQNQYPGMIHHFAMHSNREYFMESDGFLEFYPVDTLNRLWGYEISFMEIESPMVVLSGCNTGLGRINDGEGVFSLGRNFMEAGTNTVVQTLWSVSDGSSSFIIKDFYKGLIRGDSKAIALRDAKLNYLENASPFFSHPYYWAGIQIIGDVNPLVYPRIWIFGFPALTLLIIGGIYFGRRFMSRKSCSASS